MKAGATTEEAITMVRVPMIRGRRLGRLCAIAFIYMAVAQPGFARADDQKDSTFTPLPPLSANKIAAASAAQDVILGRSLMKDAKKDAEALAAFTRAAAQGNPVAEAYLGYLSYMGHGTRQDDQAAATWYQRAAEQGLVDGQLRLGLMYATGRDLFDPARNLHRDRKQALYWLKQAAYQGSWTAADQMAEIYVLEGVHNGHMDAARAFAQILAEKDDPYAIQLLCNSYNWADGNPAEKKHWCDLRDHLPAYVTDYYHRYRLLEDADIPAPASHL